jgi:hypothetical protein
MSQKMTRESQGMCGLSSREKIQTVVMGLVSSSLSMKQKQLSHKPSPARNTLLSCRNIWTDHFYFKKGNLTLDVLPYSLLSMVGRKATSLRTAT